MLRSALALLPLLLLLATGSMARAVELTPDRVRRIPLTAPLPTLSPHPAAHTPWANGTVQGGTASGVADAGRILNCGNDGIIDLDGTLILEAGDAAGTIFSAPADLDSFELAHLSFGVLDYGAAYPGTMAVDFWEETSPELFEFVGGVDVAVDSDPGLAGEILELDLTALELCLHGRVMVLMSDVASTGEGRILPAGDSSPHCYDGTSYCSVQYDASQEELFMYGIPDAQQCPDSTFDHALLFDVVVTLTVQDPDVPTRTETFGSIKARFAR